MTVTDFLRLFKNIISANIKYVRVMSMSQRFKNLIHCRNFMIQTSQSYGILQKKHCD